MEDINDNMRSYIVEKVRKFSETEQIEIFKLLQKYKINFTENSNGIFILISIKGILIDIRIIIFYVQKKKY